MKTNELNPISVTHAESVLDVLGGTFDFSNYYGNIEIGCNAGAASCMNGCFPGCKDTPKYTPCPIKCSDGCADGCKSACYPGKK